MLLRVARQAVQAMVCLGERLAIEPSEHAKTLQQTLGAFVTLRIAEELRGCIGCTRPVKSLVENVRDAAVNSAVRDPRFEPLLPDEIDGLAIEVSALAQGNTPDTPFHAVADLSEILIGRDGLFIETPDGRGGLLLPQVATERGWTVDEFVSAVCEKGKLPEGAWRGRECPLYRFTAQVFSDPGDRA